MMKKAIKYTMWVLGGLLILLVGLMAFTQTAVFRNMLRTKAIEIVNSKIKGQLQLGQIDGNLYNYLILSDISLKNGDSLIISVDSVRINYRLLPLLKKVLEVDSLFLYAPLVELRYSDSTTLNIMHAIELRGEEQSGTSSGLPITIEGRYVELVDGQSSYQLKYGKEPIRLTGINLFGETIVKERYLDVLVNNLTAEMKQPSLKLKHSYIQFQRDGNHLKIDTLSLQTELSQLAARGWYVATDSFQLAFEGRPISDVEVRSFLPSLPLRTIPELDVELTTKESDLNGDITMVSDNKSLNLKATIYNLNELMQNMGGKAAFEGVLSFRKFIPEEWVDIQPTGVYLNGTVKIEGEDVRDYRKPMRVQANLNQSVYKELVADTLNFDARQLNNQINADVLLVYNQSKSQGHLVIQDLYNVPLYHADFVTQNLDVEAIVPSLDQTVVNGHIAISGTHIITGPREFMSEATLYNSRIFDFPIDTVYLLADLSQDVMQVDSFWIEAQYNKAIGKGSYHFADKSFGAQMQLHSKGLKNFEKYGVPSVNFYRGESDLAVSGDDSEINYEGEVHFYDVNYGQLTCDTLSAIAKGGFTSDSISSEGSVTLRNAEHGDLMMDSIAARFRLLNADIWSSVNFVHSEEIKGEMESDVHLGDTILLQMKRAYLNLPDAHYYLTDTLQKVAYYSDRLKVENLEIKERLDSSFWWRSKGLLGMGAKNDFFLDVNNFHLDQLDRFIDSEDSIKGLLSLQMNLFGDVADLSLSGKYGFENARYGDLLLPDAKGELNYQTDTFTMNTWLTQLDSCVYATISVPVAIGVDTAKQFYWQKPESFDARLMIDSLSVNIPDVPEYSHLKAGANLNGTIQANGELSKPQFFGQIEVSNGHLSNYNRGIFYKEVFGVVGLNGRTIAVDTLYINSDKGYFASKGQILFDTTIVSGDVISSDLNTSIKNFHLVNHRNYDINISGNPYYRVDSSGLPQFGGKLLVNRSSFYIPGLMNNEKKDGQVKDAPLLVMAIQETDSTYERKKAEEDGQEKLLLKKLRGRLTVEIPRSTWIKGENMNIEIGGDFDIAKTGDYFELFGDVEIFRGNYILYGRKFNIEEGVITFMGGEKNDPRLDISAEYVFRGTDREKHSLKLSVTQNLSEPTISFTLDGNAISESDAVSIMVFGKTMDELNYAGQNGIIGSVGSNMLTSIVTSSLNSTIGQRLKLDMIEVNATENWTSAAFVVGKYITNDLFVIYQRGFGETEDDEITPETITLEYELNKLVFIRLQGGSSKSSGFDVILKVESTK